ncbi:MAG TPA: hypothetical protein VNZ44_09880, partial [Pyrinomonadaceae bacterium]|nr:hypothetical protein [Pyrinomonadaceae bacterium]
LPRQSGRKEARYAHLLSGPPAVEEESDAPADSSQPSNVGTVRPSSTRAGDPERVARLEAEVATLRGEIDEMRRQFEEFRKQFE